MIGQGKIIAVDDEPQVLKGIRLALEQYYDVICFTNGEEALACLRRPNNVHLVLLDVFMKGTDGITVLGEIKKINRDIAVIIVTAMGSKDVAVQALRNGADDFIDKPFDIAELREKVRTIMRAKVPMLRGEDAHMEHMKNFIARNCNSVTLTSVAEEMCFSSKYLSRLFKEKNNQGFREYKIAQKMNKAKEWLADSHLTITQISQQLGYQNTESFLRLFKQLFGLTPLQYRQKTSRKKSA